MSKHTQGPWLWDEEVPTGYLGANWQEIAPWLVDGNGDSVLEGKIACPNQNNLALIAAAPDLLEALAPFAELAKLFDDGIRGGTMPRSGVIASWPRLGVDGEIIEYHITVEHLQSARAAIAKARGES